jgi:hypothetical protein
MEFRTGFRLEGNWNRSAEQLSARHKTAQLAVARLIPASIDNASGLGPGGDPTESQFRAEVSVANDEFFP